jgi:hypothetical protein
MATPAQIAGDYSQINHEEDNADFVIIGWFADSGEAMSVRRRFLMTVATVYTGGF